MTQDEIYDVWAPAESEWSQWVKPVLFAHLPVFGSSPGNATSVEAIAESPLPSNDSQTALVLDLPGAMAVQMTGALVRQRYRPIPLYNSCPPPKSWLPVTQSLEFTMDPFASSARSKQPAVNVQPTIDAILEMTALLKAANLPANAPPAFLLDAKRRIVQPGYVSVPGAFDNRSVSLPTDFPSANFLLSRGIRKVVVVTETATPPQADLSHTLLRWQRDGISISGITANSERGVAIPQPITIRRPPYFRTAWYALMVRLGLRPNLLGGFGGVLPESGGVG
jgi:hypothetical protein